MDAILHILHLEDDALDTELVLKRMRKAGFAVEIDRVTTAAAFREALGRKNYALILSDYTVPGANIREILRLARQQCPEVPIVFFSGTMGEELGIEMLKLGASDYVLKQRIERLVPAVERALHEAEESSRRKRAEEALRASEERLRSVLETSLDAAYRRDLRLDRYDYLSPAIEQVMGITAEQMLTMPVDVLIERVHPEDRPRVQQIVHARVSPQRGRVEYRFWTNQGQYRWLADHFSIQTDAAGAPVFRSGIVRDVTEQRRAAETLRESEEKLRTLADNMSQLAWMADENGRVFWYNRRWCDYTGLSLEQMEESGWHIVHHPDHAQRVMEKISYCFRAGQAWEDTFPLRSKDGSYRWFLSRAIPICDGHGKVLRWLGTNTDVTELRDTQEALKVANAAKDRFLAVLSHELRTPLTPVLAAISLLQADRRFDPEVRENLEIIRRNVETEARLIDDLLDMTSIAKDKVKLKRRPVNLCEVLQKAIEVCRPDIEARQLQLSMDLDSCGACLINADEARLQQVFWNLIKNAVKFTAPGGRIDVRCRREAGTLVADVRDEGAGIEPDALERIFQAFEQADRSVTRQFGGLGLGLAISKSLVEMHGGSIEAHSDGKGRGALFRVRLPILADGSSDSGADGPAAPKRETVPGALRILLVEDHADTARIMCRLLTADGYEVRTAGDLAAALDLAEAERFDLLISDLGLPDGSGLDLMQQLRARGNRMPGIALSGYGQEEDLRRSREAGFATHLTKPTDPDRLAGAIAAVIRNVCDTGVSQCNGSRELAD